MINLTATSPLYKADLTSSDRWNADRRLSQTLSEWNVHSSEGKKVKVKVGFFYNATYTGNAATSHAVQPQEVAVD